MKTETFKSEVATAYGNRLPKPIPVSGSYEAFETADEVRSAQEWPSDAEVVTYVNNVRKQNARAKATTEALTAAGINKPTLDDAEFRLSEMIKILVKAGKSQEQAEQIARANLA